VQEDAISSRNDFEKGGMTHTVVVEMATVPGSPCERRSTSTAKRSQSAGNPGKAERRFREQQHGCNLRDRPKKSDRPITNPSEMF